LSLLLRVEGVDEGTVGKGVSVGLWRTKRGRRRKRRYHKWKNDGATTIKTKPKISRTRL
jgi:hypothetical protein